MKVISHVEFQMGVTVRNDYCELQQINVILRLSRK